MTPKAKNQMLYLDNAATSFPKAPGVPEAMAHFVNCVGASAGRAGHRLAREADDLLWDTRTLVARLLHTPDPRRVTFCLNVTQALNVALLGLLDTGDRVVTTAMEHNSVMRPLAHLQRTRGIQLAVAPCGADGRMAPGDLLSLVDSRTRLIVMNHASNVTGTILPVEEVAKGKGPALLLVDAAQTAGSVPIRMEEWGIDLLAFTGHKALLGPPGVGGLCLGSGVKVPALFRGGTGTGSESHDHPEELPLALEAGTHNMAGIAGLRASLTHLLHRGIASIQTHEQTLLRRLWQGLREVPRLILYGPPEPAPRVPVVSINFPGLHPGHLATTLEDGYGLLVRDGLHCAPSAHRTIGTFPDGTVRISPGPFQSVEDMDRVVDALRQISSQFFR
jgi:cysteine desulfurase family protein